MARGPLQGIAIAGVGGAAGLLAGVALGKGADPPPDVRLPGGQTSLGQAIVYPPGDPVVTAAVVTRVPGQETGWHHHDAPLLASMLEGELTVDDGPDGTRSHGAGESPPEAFRSPHDGLNAGDGIVRLMAVSIGAEGVENTVTEPD